MARASNKTIAYSRCSFASRRTKNLFNRISVAHEQGRIEHHSETKATITKAAAYVVGNSCAALSGDVDEQNAVKITNRGLDNYAHLKASGGCLRRQSPVVIRGGSEQKADFESKVHFIRREVKTTTRKRRFNK